MLPIFLTEFSLAEAGILFHKIYITKDPIKQLGIPDTFRDVVLQLVHDVPQSGYPDRDMCLAAARRIYYWPSMWVVIARHVAQ